MKTLLVCTNFRANPNQPSCAARVSKQLLADLTQKIEQNSLSIMLEESPCLGFCHVGPNARLAPNGAFFHGLSVEKLDDLIACAKEFSA